MSQNLISVTTEHIAEFVRKNSDFGFELQTLKALKNLDFVCEHGGFYEDPYSGKKRQFDIRARQRFAKDNFNLYLAIECKNLSEFNPLLVHSVSRSKEEAFHVVLHSATSNSKWIWNSQFYKQRELVGKSLDNVRVDQKTPGKLQFSGGDTETHDRYIQAVSASLSLTRVIADELYGLAQSNRSQYPKTLLLPVLVIPNDRLFIADYSKDLAKPDIRAANRANLFLGYQIGTPHAGPAPLTLSHLEICTLDGLEELLKQFREQEDYNFPNIFPE